MLKNKIGKILSIIMVLGVALNFVACGSKEDIKKNIKTPVEISQSDKYVKTMSLDDKIEVAKCIVDITQEVIDNKFVKDNVNVYKIIDKADDLSYDKDGLDIYSDLYNLAELYDDISELEPKDKELDKYFNQYGEYCAAGLTNAYSQFTVQTDFFKFCEEVNAYCDKVTGRKDLSEYMSENMTGLWNNGKKIRAEIEIPAGLNNGWDLDEIDETNRKFIEDFNNDEPSYSGSGYYDEKTKEASTKQNLVYSKAEYEKALQTLKDARVLLGKGDQKAAASKAMEMTLYQVPTKGMDDYYLLRTLQDCQTAICNPDATTPDNITTIQSMLDGMTTMVVQIN